MKVEIGTVAAQFLFWEYLFRIFSIVSLQWGAQITRILPLKYTGCMVWLFSPMQGGTFVCPGLDISWHCACQERGRRETAVYIYKSVRNPCIFLYSRAESCDSSPASTPPLSRTNSRDSSPFLSRRNSGDKDSLARGDRAPKLNLLEERLREEFGSGVFLYRWALGHVIFLH